MKQSREELLEKFLFVKRKINRLKVTLVSRSIRMPEDRENSE